MVEKLRPVVAMESQNPEGKLVQHRLQYGNQMSFADGFGAAHHLPMRHRVDRVEVIHSRLSVVLPLMNGVHTKITRPPFWVGLAALPDRYFAPLGVLNPHSDLPVSRRPPQVVDMRGRDARQPLELLVAKHHPGSMA